MSTYFHVLPVDLMSPLFLYFSSGDLLHILPQLDLISFPKSLYNSKILWCELWKRDISSFLELPGNPYEKYQKIFNEFSILKFKFEKIKHLASNCYDILLHPLLSNVYDYNIAMIHAAEGGHIELVNSMLKLGANDYNWTLVYAARGGHMEIIKLMLNLGASDYNFAMEDASREGHLDIVEFMLELGADHYNTALVNGAAGGHIEIVKLMLQKGAREYNTALAWAAAGGHTEIVKLMLKLGANDYNHSMLMAAREAHIDIVELIELEKRRLLK